MRWFQHQSDSYSNLKIQKLRKVFGLEGIGFWWLCCELIGQQGDDYMVEKEKDWLSWLEIQSGLPIERINAMLEKMAEFHLILSEKYEKGHLSIPQMCEYSDDYSKRVRRVSEQGSESVRQDKIRIDKNRLDKNRIEYTTEFELFWKEYPNKIGKRKAFESWLKVSPDSALQEVILKSIGNHKASRQWQEDDGRYIPHPTTWLNQERWQDSPPEAKKGIISFKKK